ncbi:sodium/calcium exchanger protein [Salinibaculum rarum]|uniref:sodium/calcium exchanger protein n=1 Tax=Salinibaculum rarum TaxID=3058903 RepID=UPI00265EB540|nr:sodium:calcium antiporter [Salinibaculum sp. KK48]
MSRLRHPLTAIAVAVAVSAPWVGIWATGTGFGDVATVAISGIAVLGASFLLTWGAETAEKDVPRAFAIAVLAVLAVAPEYAVDALYAWGAGAGGATAEACQGVATGGHGARAASGLASACQDANLAVANMTGANRILIGIGWAGIALLTVWQARRTADPAVDHREGFLATRVTLDKDIATEITFLFAATTWAFFVPLGGGIDILDFVVLVGLYVVYIGIIIRGDIEAGEEHVGVPAYLQSFPRPLRIVTVLGLFVFSGFLIFIAVEPFAHGLENIGESVGIPAFFMIQWIAPLASESPELIVVSVLVYKARSTAGFNALISSKLNQWTLLIGTLVVVYSLALGRYGTLPFDQIQAAEIWITAAQSFFALALLVDFSISVREAVALFTLFISQVLLEFTFLRVWEPFPDPKFELLVAYTVVYLVLGTAILVVRRHRLRELFELTAFAVRKATGRHPTKPDHAD